MEEEPDARPETIEEPRKRQGSKYDYLNKLYGLNPKMSQNAAAEDVKEADSSAEESFEDEVEKVVKVIEEIEEEGEETPSE